MSYVKSALQPGETIKAIGKLHWVIYLPAFLIIGLGAAAMLASQRVDREMSMALCVGGGVVVLFGLASLLHNWFKRWITELAVTDHRVIYKCGFIRRHTTEMNMDKIETVNVDQSIAGRLLGFGTIHVLGTGQGMERLDCVASPLQPRSAITAR